MGQIFEKLRDLNDTSLMFSHKGIVHVLARLAGVLLDDRRLTTNENIEPY